MRAAVGIDDGASVDCRRQHGDGEERPREVWYHRNGVGDKPGQCGKTRKSHQVKRGNKIDELNGSGSFHALFDEGVALDEMNAKLLGLRLFLAFGLFGSHRRLFLFAHWRSLG